MPHTPYKTPRPALGTAMVSLAALLFAFNGTASKLLLRNGVPAVDLTVLRAVGACLGLLIIGVALRPGIRRFRITVREIPLLVGYGLIGFFLVPLLYFVGISRMPVGIALLFEFTAPLFLAMWAKFGQRRQVRSRMWVGLALSLVGLAFVAEIWGDLRLDPIGVAASLSAAVLLACYFLLGAKGVATRDTVSLTGLACGVSAIAGLLVRGGNIEWQAVTTSTETILQFAYLIVFGTIAPFLLIAGSLRHLSPTSSGIIGMMEPVFASGIAWVTLHEKLNLAQLTGGVLLLLGVGLAETARIPIKPTRQNDAHVAPEHAGQLDRGGSRQPA